MTYLELHSPTFHRRAISRWGLLAATLTVGLLASAEAQVQYTWSQMDSGTTVTFGRQTGNDGNSTLAVWSSTLAIALGGDDTAIIWDGTSWEPLFDEQNDPFDDGDYQLERSSVAITNPDTIAFATFGAPSGDSFTRRYVRALLPDLNSAQGRPSGGNDRLRALWTDPDPNSTLTLAANQRSGANTIYWSATGAPGGGDGSGWTRSLDHDNEELATAIVRKIHGTGPSNIFALAGGATLLHSTNGGESWSAPIELPGAAAEATGVFTLSSTATWVTGDDGEIHFWDGNVFTLQSTPTTETLSNILAFSANDAWAVGNNSTILYWDGTSWELADTGIDFEALGFPHLYDIGADEKGHLYVVGQGGVILQAIPEPGTTLLLLAAGSLFLARTRRPGSSRPAQVVVA